ncbi:Ras Gtpase-Activating Protein 2 [Manis pentadactyla]|nr:Ras Gtpase-Activating Protein 2 [Manis pentadactyla]
MVTLENLAPRRVPRKPQYESKFLSPLVTARIAEPHLLSLHTSLANVLRTGPFVSVTVRMMYTGKEHLSLAH